MAIDLTADEIGIVYGAASGFLRRIYASDAGDKPSVPDPLPGEALLVRNREKLADLSLDTLRAEIASELGRSVLPQGADRTVIIDEAGIVVGVIPADPAIDVLPGFDLKLHPEADTADQYDVKSDSFLRPYAVVDGETGIVVDIEYLALPSQSPTTPDGKKLFAKGDLQIGDKVFDPGQTNPVTQP